MGIFSLEEILHFCLYYLFRGVKGYLRPSFPPRYFLSYNNNDEENHLAPSYLSHTRICSQKNR